MYDYILYLQKDPWMMKFAQDMNVQKRNRYSKSGFSWTSDVT